MPRVGARQGFTPRTAPSPAEACWPLPADFAVRASEANNRKGFTICNERMKTREAEALFPTSPKSTRAAPSIPSVNVKKTAAAAYRRLGCFAANRRKAYDARRGLHARRARRRPQGRREVAQRVWLAGRAGGPSRQ